MTSPADIAGITAPLATEPRSELAPAIEASGLSRSFGETHAVIGASLTVETGGVFGLLGPDGAGKSTLIRMLATVLQPDAGDASVFGHSVTRASGRVTPRIGYMSQRFSMYPDLTVAENLEFFATIRSVPRRDRATRATALLESMGLAEFRDRQAQYLSGGMKQKLMLAATLMHEPELLLLDEPTTGVDPVSRREFWRIIAGLRQRGKTVLVATPYMDEAERCTAVAFMDNGRIRHSGTPAQIKSLVPGTLFEIAAEHPARLLPALAPLPGLASVHLYGDVVRVLTRPGGPDSAALEAAARGSGFPVDDVRTVRVDMEAAFAFLAEEARVDGAAARGAEGGGPR